MDEYGTQPEHLADQMVCSLEKAIVYISKDVYDDELELELASDYKGRFRATFEKLRVAFVSKLKSGNVQGYDAHKLAAIACLSVMTVRPLSIPANGEFHAVNEMLAFYLAIHIIRDSQIHRLCGEDRVKQAVIKKKLAANGDVLFFPPPISDSLMVPTSAILALWHLKGLLRESENPVDIAPILSSLFYYIDSCSYNNLKIEAEMIVSL
jgi:hypothetical protein